MATLLTEETESALVKAPTVLRCIGIVDGEGGVGEMSRE